MIVSAFDSACFSFGDQDAIFFPNNDDATLPSSLCYYEIQESSKFLASQLVWRYRPDYVLLDTNNHVAAEAVATMACARIRTPFVPVSTQSFHSGRRFQNLIETLRQSSSPVVHLTAIVSRQQREEEDLDRHPILGVYHQANIHNILWLDQQGNLIQNQMNVPSSLDLNHDRKGSDDDLYVLFTSGTSGRQPKAVVGSHQSTWKRLQWFSKTQLSTCSDIDLVARKTPLTFVDSITELLSGLLFPTKTRLVALLERNMDLGTALMETSSLVTQFTLLPSQLSQLLVLLRSNKKTDVAWKRIIVSGEPFPESLWWHYLQTFPDAKTRPKLIHLYGQTETTGDVLCAVLTEGDSSWVVHQNTIAVGTPLFPEIQVTTRKQLMLPSTDNQDGKEQELIISGNLSNGYMPCGGKDDGSSCHHQSSFFTLDEETTWFATGDVGFCHNGVWYVQGREGDVLKINGVLTSVTEVETAFLQVFFPSQQKTEDNDHDMAVVVVAVPYYCQDNGNENQHAMPSAGATPVMMVAVNQPMSQPFSRQVMNEAGIPWNLIPRQVFSIPKMPRNTNGKIDRAAVEQKIYKCLQQEKTYDADTADGDDVLSSTMCSVLNLSSPQAVDKTKSFVEHGGDSATAVTMLYQLQQAGLLEAIKQPERSFDRTKAAPLTATDILRAPSIHELESIMSSSSSRPTSLSEPVSKRQRIALSQFTPKPIFRYTNREFDLSQHHWAVEFAACVDASPLVQGDIVYGACQGGVVQRIDCKHQRIDACCQLTETTNQDNNKKIKYAEWMIQAGMVMVDETSVIVCAYAHGDETMGLIVSLSLDLQTVLWKRVLHDGSIKSTPVLISHGQDDENSSQGLSGLCLCVVAGITLHVLDAMTGVSVLSNNKSRDDHKIILPVRPMAKPAVIFKHQKQDSVVELVFASSEWEEDGNGLVVVNMTSILRGVQPSECSDASQKDKWVVRTMYTNGDAIIGPVWRDLNCIRGTKGKGDGENGYQQTGASAAVVVVSDLCGVVHFMDSESYNIVSKRSSQQPLTIPCVVDARVGYGGDSNKNKGTNIAVVVGSNDGAVRCLESSTVAGGGEDGWVEAWTFVAGSVVHAKPLLLELQHKEDDISHSNQKSTQQMVVVTTTAGDIFGLSFVDGRQLWRHRIHGEIWSGPVVVNTNEVTGTGYTSTIAFGARDSRLHFLCAV